MINIRVCKHLSQCVISSWKWIKLGVGQNELKFNGKWIFCAFRRYWMAFIFCHHPCWFYLFRYMRLLLCIQLSTGVKLKNKSIQNLWSRGSSPDMRLIVSTKFINLYVEWNEILTEKEVLKYMYVRLTVHISIWWSKHKTIFCTKILSETLWIIQ